MFKTTINTIILLCLATGLNAEPTKAPASPKSPAPDSCQIRNKKFGELLRPEDANSANGTPIVLYPGQPWKCMTWRMLPTSDETKFHLQNHFTSKTFTASSQSDKSQHSVTQVPFGTDAKDRPLWQVTKLPDGLYKITDPESGNALTATKDNVNLSPRIVVAPWQNSDDQKWELLKIDPKSLTM